jgi:flagellin
VNSILHNAGAMSALQALNTTQQALATTQNQVSTGLAVSAAKDNAAYWSIGEQLKASSGIAQAANTALAQSQAIFDTANSAINSVITTINSIQTALTQASNPGANLTDINTTLASLSKQLTDAVAGASFNGVNLINSSNKTGTLSNFVSGYDAAAGAANLISFQGQSLVASGAFSATTALGATAGPTETLATITDASQIASFFNLTGAAGAPTAVAQNTTTADNGLSGAGGATAGVLNMYSFDNQGNLTTTTYTAYDASGTAIGATSTAASAIASLQVTRTVTAADNSATPGTATASGLLVQTGTTATQLSYDLTNLGNGTGATAVSAANSADMLSAVTQALNKVTNYAAQIGATQVRMTAATNFNSAITTNYANGVSALVDADMNTASTRLQALQTQQQLGIQSLSIANQNAQLIMKLFG